MSDFKACTEDDVKDALDYISGDDRETWIMMGCAIKNEFGHSGFDLWDSWSRLQAGYNKTQIMADWKGIKAYGKDGSVTIATLFKRAMGKGYEQRPINEDERKEREVEKAKRAKQRAIDEKVQREHDEKFRQAAASVAIKIWRSTAKSGNSPYLDKKQVKAFDVGFIKQGLIILYDELLASIQIIAGREQISTFFADKSRPEHQSFLYVKPGVLAVPLVDAKGLVKNLQFIFQDGAKKFIKGGVKSGCFTRLGLYENSHTQLVIAEGYSTAASIHEATDLTVYVAFDAGNLSNVAQLLRKEFPAALMLFAADDDKETQAQGKGNPGKDKAKAAAKLVNGFMVLPDFGIEHDTEGAAA